MAEIESTEDTRYTLKLAAQPSRELNAAFQDFIRPIGDHEPVEMRIARKALQTIRMTSTRVVQFDAPAQIDRGMYGEGNGVGLGTYMADMSNIFKDHVAISESEESSGFKINGRGDGMVWLTLNPSEIEKDVLVQPPLYDEKDDNPDLKMYFLINHLFFVGKASAGLALNSLHKRLQDQTDEQADLKIQRDRLVAEAAALARTGAPTTTPDLPYKPLDYYVTQLHVQRTKQKLPPPLAGSQALPKAA